MSTHWLRSAVPFALLTASFVLAPDQALACTCEGIRDIGTALSRSQVVVVGEVVRREELNGYHYDRSPRADVVEVPYGPPIVVKVREVLQGEAGAEVRITSPLMCARSFDVEDFEIGGTYVFPVSSPSDRGLHLLPSCSESGLKLVDGDLYRQVWSQDGSHSLRRYMSLPALKLLLPVRVLDRRMQAFLAAATVLAGAVLITWRVRRRRSSASPVQMPVDFIAFIRSLRWRPGLATAWMLMCAGSCIVLAINKWDWMIFLLGAVFAFAAAGIAARWRWSEGLSYGLSLFWIGFWLLELLEVLWWYFIQDSDFTRDYAFRRLLPRIVIALCAVLGMAWCVHAVRRRFAPAVAQSSQTAA